MEMNKRPLKETAVRLVILLIGLTVAHLGVTLFLLANLGADPFNVFIQGLFRQIQELTDSGLFTHGRVHMSVCILIIVILLLTDRSYIKIGTIICMFFGGPIIDMFTELLGGVIGPQLPLALRIAVNCAGCAILAFGMTIVIKSDAGTGPNDLVAVVISDKSKKKFSIVRMLVDIVFALAGFLLGGTIGIGTVICAFVVGPVAGLFMPFNGRIIEKTVAKLAAERNS